jgi:hypothetical protein
MRRISFRGALVGGFIDVIGSGILGIPLFAIASASYVSSHPGASLSQINLAVQSNPLTIANEWLVGGACSVLGGYVAARFANRDEILNGALSAWLCVLTGILYWNADNAGIAQHMLAMIASPLLGAVGGYLLLRWRAKGAVAT